MRVTVNRELLLQALKACGPVIPSRTPKDVLQCMHASVKDKQLCLRATDMEMTVEATLTQVDPVQDGQILIPFERLAGVANSAGTDTMILSGEDVGDVVQVKAGQGTFRIFSQPASDEYPKEASSIRLTWETWIRVADVRLRPVNAPAPSDAHQRRPWAGAETMPTTPCAPPGSRVSRAISVAQTGTPRT